MTKLSDTQLVILSAAAQREDSNVLPLPGSLRGRAAAKVVGALLSRGLIAETTTDSRTKADAATQPDLAKRRGRPRHPPAHHRRGTRAIGVEPESRDSASTGADAAPTAEATKDAPAETDPAPKARTLRTGTKQAKLIKMIRSEGGATIDEIVAALDWRPHTVRGVFAGALKKKLGLTVTSETIDGRGRVYTICD